jgi:hypothetical protein
MLHGDVIVTAAGRPKPGQNIFQPVRARLGYLSDDLSRIFHPLELAAPIRGAPALAVAFDSHDDLTGMDIFHCPVFHRNRVNWRFPLERFDRSIALDAPRYVPIEET